MTNNCPKCGKELGGSFAFCPYCGYKDTSVPPKLTNFETAKILLGSFFLSPISIYWFFKYRKYPETRKVAYISLIITVAMFVLGVITTVFYVNAVNNSLVAGGFAGGLGY